jgi:endonuclease III
MPEKLSEILKRLEQHYGKAAAPPASGPLEMILWENTAYLVNDARRKSTFESFKKEIGIAPQQILEASFGNLKKALQDGGIILDQRVKKFSSIGKIVMADFGGDLNQVLDFPTDKAKKALQLFPGVGEPVAEKILLFCHRLPVLALESNGLRSLLRLGFGSEQKNFRATYHSVQEAVKPELVHNYEWLISAHQMLRIHGQELCKRNKPRCKQCPLMTMCVYAMRRA